MSKIMEPITKEEEIELHKHDILLKAIGTLQMQGWYRLINSPYPYESSCRYVRPYLFSNNNNIKDLVCYFIGICKLDIDNNWCTGKCSKYCSHNWFTKLFT
jgi:hypothetical protein